MILCYILIGIFIGFSVWAIGFIIKIAIDDVKYEKELSEENKKFYDLLWQDPEFEIDSFKLEKEWDNKKADYVYVFYQYRKHFKTEYDLRGHLAIGRFYSWDEIERGNLKWAKKIAKHYGLEVFHKIEVEKSGITHDE